MPTVSPRVRPIHDLRTSALAVAGHHPWRLVSLGLIRSWWSLVCWAADDLIVAWPLAAIQEDRQDGTASESAWRRELGGGGESNIHAMQEKGSTLRQKLCLDLDYLDARAY